MSKRLTEEDEARFRELGRRLGVVSVSCRGELGLFEGSIDDEVVHGSYLRTGRWSAGMLHLLLRHLFPEGRGTFLDIGANIGLVSIPVAEQRGVSCLAFEPEPLNFSMLKRNVSGHGLDDKIETFNVALYSEDTRIRLGRSSFNSGDNRLQPDATDVSRGELGGRCVEVEAARLDTLVDPARLERPIVVKMDTQGAEVRVLEGATRLLPEVDFLISEYWPRGLRSMGDSAERFWKLVKDFPFGAVLDQAEGEVALESVDQTCWRLAWVPTDGSDDGFFDIIAARHAAWPSDWD